MTVSIYKLELSKEEIIRELCDISQWKVEDVIEAASQQQLAHQGFLRLTWILADFEADQLNEMLSEIWELISSVEMKPLIEKMECALRRCKEEDLRKMYDGEKTSKEATEIMNQFCIEAAEWITDNSLVLGIENCDQGG